MQDSDITGEVLPLRHLSGHQYRNWSESFKTVVSGCVTVEAQYWKRYGCRITKKTVKLKCYSEGGPTEELQWYDNKGIEGTAIRWKCAVALM